MKKALIRLPRLNDAGGDLTKKWFIFYSVRNPSSEKMERFKTYKELHKHKTKKARYACAERIKEEITEKLKSGWTPFDREDQVIYEDDFQYKGLAAIYGKRRKSNLTIRYYANQYVQRLDAGLSPASIRTYRSKLRIFCNWIDANSDEDNDVSAITHAKILQFFDWIIFDRKLSGNSVGKYKQLLLSLFEKLLKEKKIHENPVHSIPPCNRINDCTPRPILRHDVEIFKQRIMPEDPQLWLSIQLQYYCFIRPGQELRLLKVGDVELARGVIHIERFRAKTSQERFATIPTVLLDELRTKWKLASADPNHYLLGRHDGVPGPQCFGKNTLRNRFNKYRDELNMPKSYKFYSWKHTGNSAAIDSPSISNYELQQQNGHSSIATTEKYVKNKIGRVSASIRDDFPEL